MKDHEAQELIGCYLYEMCSGTLWRIDGIDLTAGLIHCHGIDNDTLERSNGNWTLDGDELRELCQSGSAAIYHPHYLRGLLDGLNGVHVGQTVGGAVQPESGTLVPLTSRVH